MPRKSAAKPKRGVEPIPEAPPDKRPEVPPDAPQDYLFAPVPGSDARVRIERLDDMRKKWTFHGYIGVDEATEATVAALFGGGRYRALYIEPDASGQSPIRDQRYFDLPGRYKPPLELPGVKAKEVAPPAMPGPAPAGTSPGHVSAAELVSQAQVSQLLEIIQANRGRSVDWTPLVNAALGAGGFFTVVAEALLNKKPAPDRQSEEISRALERLERTVADMKAQPGPTTSAMTDAMAAVERMITIRDLLSPEPSGNGGGSALASVAGKLLDILQQRGAAAPSAPMPQVASPDAAPMDPNAPMWRQMLVHYRPQLLDAARRGIHGGDTANLAMQLIPREYEGVVVEFARSPEARARLLDAVPGLGEFPQWVDDFLGGLRDSIQENEEEVE